MSRKPAGVSPDEARLLVITAELKTPSVMHAVWPMPLDGLLAHVGAQRQAPVYRRGQLARPTVDLPLVRARTSSSQWWWWASCAEHEDGAAPSSRQAGRRVELTDAITWWALGDADGVMSLVGDVAHVGERGSGRVAKWYVEDRGRPDYATVAWTDDLRPSRPFPVQHAAALGFGHNPPTVTGAFRPPYLAPPAGSHELRIERTKRTLVAPAAIADEDTEIGTERM